MKSLLENYLYLLTEDAEMEELNKKYSEARKKLFKYGSGPEGHDALSSKYRDTPEHKIPEHHRKTIRNYRAAKDEFDEISKKRTEHSSWIRNGKQGPKPGSRAWQKKQHYNHYSNSGYSAEYARRMAKSQKFARNVNTGLKILYFGALAGYVISLAYSIYLLNFDKAHKACKKHFGLNDAAYNKCMINYKISAYKKEISVLKNNLSKASRTSDPQKYKEKLNKRIESLKTKIIKLEIKLQKV